MTEQPKDLVVLVPKARGPESQMVAATLQLPVDTWHCARLAALSSQQSGCWAIVCRVPSQENKLTTGGGVQLLQ